MSGKIILLNGASSSGKTSIALAIQGVTPEPFLHYSFDHLRGSGVLPLDRMRRGDFDWPQMREGFFDGFHQSIRAFAQADNNLIVDHIVETPAWMQRLVELLGDLDVFFVGVHCPVEELERREAVRGDRRKGEARRDYESVHIHAVYDLELDSTVQPAANATTLLEAWRQRPRPGAFQKMAQAG